MRTARKIAIVLVALVAMTVGTALPAHAGAEGDFLSKINASRSAVGLPPVSMHSDLVPAARNHSAEMMAAGQIYHTSNLAGVASGWEALAENVGVGPSVDNLHTAFMNSAGHRANILGDYNYVGVGVASEGDVLWVTVIFMRKGAAPEATTTTTAAPPTTSTTTTVAAPAATTTTNPPAPGPVAESTTTTTPVAPTNSTNTPASNQSAEASSGAVPEPGPSVEMQISAQALHLPIAD